MKTSNHSTLTVEVAGETRTFSDGDGITFPKNVGGKRRFTVDRVQFAGYGLDAPGANHQDFSGLAVKGAAVVWLGSAGPKGVDQSYRRLLAGRGRYATDQLRAAASIGPESPLGGRRSGRGAPAAADAAMPGNQGQPPPGGLIPSAPERPGQMLPAQPPSGGRAGFVGVPIPAADFTTVQRLDAPIPPAVAAKDAFFDKMTRIVQLVYDTGVRVANLDHAPVRDNEGPRAGRATTARP